MFCSYRHWLISGALLFFALLGLSGCFITCYDRRVRNDLAQPCRELCLCCCHPGYDFYFLIYSIHIILNWYQRSKFANFDIKSFRKTYTTYGHTKLESCFKKVVVPFVLPNTCYDLTLDHRFAVISTGSRSSDGQISCFFFHYPVICYFVLDKEISIYEGKEKTQGGGLKNHWNSEYKRALITCKCITQWNRHFSTSPVSMTAWG